MAAPSDPAFVSVMDLIGNTPMVEARRLDTGPCRLFLKLESQNPGGSIKDRIAVSMIEAAEKAGLKKNALLVEATAGNTGLGLALVAAQKGYRVLIVVPDKMSQEKIFHLRALGAEVVMTRSDVTKGHPDYYQDKAARIAAERDGFYVNQFANPANPLAHQQSTGPEIWKQMEQRVDAVVAGVGTGGTITGLSRFFEKVSPDRDGACRSCRFCFEGFCRNRKAGQCRLVAGGRHRRGFPAADLRPVSREARLQHPRPRSVPGLP